MTILLIIVLYILNVFFNRFLSIQIQKNDITSRELSGFLTFSCFISISGTIVLLLILLTNFLENSKITLNWFKYTPIIVLFLFTSCAYNRYGCHYYYIKCKGEYYAKYPQRTK